MGEGWTKTVSLEELKAKGRHVHRQDGRQIAIFDTPRGVFACNNRCPHEGYPLREGTLDADCKLTCNWHNWKFDLATGENQRDGDRLRVYPVELRDGDVWIEIVDPPVAERKAKTMADLETAFRDHDYERIARELARLVQIGADPTEAVAAAIGWSHDRFEFGWSHAYAGVADWLRLYDERAEEPENRLICLLEAIGHMADDTLREEVFPYETGVEAWNEEAFVAAIEAEDEARAIRLTRGALMAGNAFALMERALTRGALAHYNDFGHALIYVPHAGSLIARLGEGVAAPVLLSLVRGLASAFREDLIPEFRGYADALASFGTKPNGAAPAPEAFLAHNANKALAFTAEHGTASARDLFRSLLAANAMNMLTFHLRHLGDLDQPYGSDFGWLDLTHGLTFSNAVRKQCGRYPELWPAGLLQMACFSGRNIGHGDASVGLEDWKVADPDTFFAEVEETLFDHHQDEYIVSVHLLKTALAVRDLVGSQEAGEAGDIAMAALNRLLHSPIRTKMVRRTARQAMRFVATDV